MGNGGREHAIAWALLRSSQVTGVYCIPGNGGTAVDLAGLDALVNTLAAGGIIGLGESMEDRIELALELRALGIRSIPLNIHTPISGTPLAELPPLPLTEALTTVALFRFLNPEAVIRMAGGRQLLGPEQHRCFAAGANGAIVGNYLTTAGCSVAEDIARLREMGFVFPSAAA